MSRWLVDLAAAGTFEQEAEEEAGIEDEDDDFMRSISLRKPKAGRQSGHHPAESMPDRAARMGLICDVLLPAREREREGGLLVQRQRAVNRCSCWSTRSSARRRSSVSESG